ncbi:S1C family serine protease [Ruminiclostridium cellulolyticum]|uniref:Peptidase S1 and S6 chymotrypsin/Hap n=1 Tax=Ruminiclostridium cellulolyticum (strain ATCC 35319 / DSM 5812 / JCM 6584 / H10) TaxID=394503 RepID=B8I3E3_RUMCH|nr:trypsin-like peptidase domain-containing protein [Ruminiclostridium cellulolyticum]ACL76286.1 peptidase S1 and S6 chymotrypsin/Hap [Ruminiclostridium cellulolyticum H10]
MKKFNLVRCAFLVIVSVLCTANTFAAGTTLRINGQELIDGVKTIEGRQYISADAISSHLEGITVTQGNNTIEINSVNKISNVVSKVSPSVVGIIGKLKESSYEYDETSDNIIFGTGVIYRSSGYIITNAHVVKDMESIVVVLSNSKAYKARLKAIDEDLDLAEIKIDKGGLQPAKFGDISQVAVGDEVVAIGTPLSFGLRNSATRGIISGMNRSENRQYRFIQTDAAINSGNSGGPLVNMKGEVVGINSWVYAGIGVQGMSFSIPIDSVRYAINQFEKFGKIRRPYLGLAFSDSITSIYGLPNTVSGVTVKSIEKGSPAQKYNIKVDDRLISINGIKVNSTTDYNEEMKKYLPGDIAEFKLQRDNREFSISVTFGEK